MNENANETTQDEVAEVLAKHPAPWGIHRVGSYLEVIDASGSTVCDLDVQSNNTVARLICSAVNAYAKGEGK